MLRIIPVLAIACVLAPAVSGAQPAAPPSTQTPPSAQPPAPRPVAGQDGLAIESGNGEYRLQFGLLVHADGRFALQDENEQYIDSFAIRRLRPNLRGRLTRRFEFYINPDFSGSTLVVQDAYIDAIFSPALRVRAGKGKTPFGFERLHPASNMLFLERGFPTALAPNRDIGVQVLGDLSGGIVSYLAGVMNGVADGASADVETADGKDLSARVVVRPFNRLPAASVLRGLAVVSPDRGAMPSAEQHFRPCAPKPCSSPTFRTRPPAPHRWPPTAPARAIHPRSGISIARSPDGAST